MSSVQPKYRAFTVVKREGQDDFWVAIGAAFEHADKEGLNIVLQAFPLDGRIVLRSPKEEDTRDNRREPNKTNKRR